MTRKRRSLLGHARAARLVLAQSVVKEETILRRGAAKGDKATSQTFAADVAAFLYLAALQPPSLN